MTQTSPSMGVKCEGSTLSRNNCLRHFQHARSTHPECDHTQIAYNVEFQTAGKAHNTYYLI